MKTVAGHGLPCLRVKASKRNDVREREQARFPSPPPMPKTWPKRRRASEQPSEEREQREPFALAEQVVGAESFRDHLPPDAARMVLEATIQFRPDGPVLRVQYLAGQVDIVMCWLSRMAPGDVRG